MKFDQSMKQKGEQIEQKQEKQKCAFGEQTNKRGQKSGLASGKCTKKHWAIENI